MNESIRKEIVDAVYWHNKCVPFDTYKYLWMTYHTWVLEKQKIVYFSIPKNACTMLKRMMLRIEGHSLPEDVGKVHDCGRHLSHYSLDEIQYILISPEWFKFCFVRNPYSRFLSAYKSKIGRTGWIEDQFKPVIEDIRARGDYPSDRGAGSPTISFRDFVEYVANSDKTKMDPHWELQVNTVRFGNIPYSLIGRVETIEQDMAEVFRKTNIQEKALERINDTIKTPLAWCYDRYTAGLVYEIYKQDFDAFGYDKDSWLFR